MLAGRVSPKNACRIGLIAAIVDVRQEECDLDDVLRASPGRREHAPESLEDDPSLLDDVVAADQLAALVDRHHAGDEEEVVGSHGVRVVADRDVHALDLELLALHPEPS